MAQYTLSNDQRLAKHAQRLALLGYTSADQVAGALAVAGDEMARFLGEDIRGVMPPPAAAASIPRFSLGFAIDQLPRIVRAFAVPLPPPAGLPASVNLVSQMPPVRNQADRGTCVAHGLLAAVEHLRGTQGAFNEMAEQFLYFNCKQHDGIPNFPGTFASVGAPLLQSDGCCREVTWPYNPEAIAGNEGQGTPHPAALAEAPSFRVGSVNMFAPTSVDAIKSELTRGRAVAFCFPVFNSWYMNPAVHASGEITMPLPGETPAGGHCVCLSGYFDNPLDILIGGGRFIVRNSWDPWGTISAFGPGYGTMPYNYVTFYGQDVAVSFE